jgi:hypothetical protein
MSLLEKYMVVLIGWVLGQLLFILVQAALVHRSSKYENTFSEAFRIYFRKDRGPFYVGLVLMLIVVFVLPEIIGLANSSTLEDPNHGKYARIVVNNLRISSVGLGIVAQLLGFLLVSKASKWIQKQGGDISINPADQTIKTP